jgi:hypothetical protein
MHDDIKNHLIHLRSLPRWSAVPWKTANLLTLNVSLLNLFWSSGSGYSNERQLARDAAGSRHAWWLTDTYHELSELQP